MIVSKAEAMVVVVGVGVLLLLFIIYVYGPLYDRWMRWLDKLSDEIGRL